MKPVSGETVNIVGAGLAGGLLAVLLARRGFAVHLCERRADPRTGTPERGRSINLALAARGIRALEHAGLMERMRPLLIPMRGRMVHDMDGSTQLQPYGQREHEVNYSIERAALGRVLIEAAAQHPLVTFAFEETCLGAVPARNILRVRGGSPPAERERPLAPMIAADGAGSAVRISLAAAGLLQRREEWLDHDYKELDIPPADGRHALFREALHIWPRHGFMLIALPNTDATFTATLFLAREGPVSFAAFATPGSLEAFLRREFPDAAALIPDLPAQLARNPQGKLGTVHAAPWRVGGQVLLLGDAAHAIVPFHGQGMNAAFEDCLALDALIDSHDSWESLFAAFEEARRDNTEAIAQMALENYIEMRDTVLDPGFVRRQAIALALERRWPDRFIPRYQMVMFHPEIGYAEALARGDVQEAILQELDTRRGTDGEPDLKLAERLILERLVPIAVR